MGDCECPYYHCGDRLRGSVLGLGDYSAGLGGRAAGADDIFQHHVVHIHTTRQCVPLTGLEEPEPDLYGRGPVEFGREEGPALWDCPVLRSGGDHGVTMPSATCRTMRIC
ncbi:hypothetical protein LINGRAHAP2_LOCUS32414 [Linum grandiflorum]